MSGLVGVHGIGQQQYGRQQLLGLWGTALADGLERACGRAVTAPPLNIAFYGDLFLTPDTGMKATPVDEEKLDDLDDSELADLIEAGMQLLTAADLAAVDAMEPKGYNRVPLALQRILRALDERFDGGGALYLGEVRQVRRYLCSPEIKQAVDERVAAAIDAGTRVLIGHSLGSVVAFEYVRQHPDRPVDLLLTLGSPLALRMVRDRMPDPTYGAVGGLPLGLGAWVNVRDPRDPVACAGGLRQWWPKVTDYEVDNQGDAHSVERYLGKRITGQAVLTALPELSER